MSLSLHEERRAAIIGRALFPADVFGGIRKDADLGLELGRSARAYPWWSALVLHFSLWMVWFSPILLRRRRQTFGGLPEADREAVLETLLSSPIYLVRQAADFLKLYLCVTFLGDLSLLQKLGAYDLRPEDPPSPIGDVHARNAT